jgi:hypothetical protein
MIQPSSLLRVYYFYLFSLFFFWKLLIEVINNVHYLIICKLASICVVMQLSYLPCFCHWCRNKFWSTVSIEGTENCICKYVAIISSVCPHMFTTNFVVGHVYHLSGCTPI